MSHAHDLLGLKRFAERVDRASLLAVLGLLGLSLVTLYSVTHAPVPEGGNRALEVGQSIFHRQIVFKLFVHAHSPSLSLSLSFEQKQIVGNARRTKKYSFSYAREQRAHKSVITSDG